MALINARIRAMRSRLLSKVVFEDLLTLSELSEMVQRLEQTVYKMGLGENSTPFSMKKVEKALLSEWTRIMNKMYLMTDGRLREFFNVLIRPWEGEALKTLLRGKQAHREGGEILQTVIPVGSMDEVSLAELARQPSIQAIVDVLTLWGSVFAKPLRKVLASHPDLKRMDEIDFAIDRFCYEESGEMLDGENGDTKLLKTWVALNVDRVNLLTAFKISNQTRGSEIDADRYFIQGGRDFPIKIFHSMAATRGWKAFAEVLQKTPYESLIKNMEREREEMSSSLLIERGMTRFILDKVQKMIFADPLGIGLMIEFLVRKKTEIENVRTIFLAKQYGMYLEDIRSLLVFSPMTR